MQRGRKPVTTLKLLESPRTKKSCKTRSCHATTTVASLKTINQLKEYGKATYLRAKKTRKCYMGHVKQGREWLAEHFHTETDSNEQSAPDVANKQEDDSDPYRDPESPNAFSRIPNKMSDKALTLFLTYKGYHQNRSNGTVEGICAAFKDLWDNVKGDTYHGPWHFNEVRKQWEGNPVNSAEWLEFAHYGCTLAPDGCVFPVMGANGIVHPRKPLSHDTIQKWINEAVDDAGIPGFFSTHCFRRGGAQYHFMFAPVGQCWTLAKVHWWGGWAEQEQRNTLIHYLLDKLYAYKADYSNALAPIQQELDQSLVGEAALVQPMSTEELRMVHSSVTVNMQELQADMDNIAQSVCALVEIVTGSANNGDEARFVQAYPEAKQGITSLLKAINTARMACGDSIERLNRVQLPPRA
ncbi:hypothetical protein BS17DRAFT_880530 [Gyrodon lividus]|nr:hypothetical protein BS17DRAFT_880530 [Gyrodon lividus]